MREKIAFKPHKTRGKEIIKILEGMGGVNKYNLDGSKGIIAIDYSSNKSITNDWDYCGLLLNGWKIYNLEGYENKLCEKSPPSPTTGFVEEENKPKFKVGDIIISNAIQLKWKVIDVERTGYRLKSVNNPDMICDMDLKNEHYYRLMEEEMKSEDELLNEYEELTDRAFKGGYEKCKSDIELNGFQLPDGYQFKDENGNIINAQKIVLEKKSPKTDDIIKWLREHDMTKYIRVLYSGMCSIQFDVDELIEDLCKNI